jgi:tetratricopeptide (TPR) repeat protein
MGASVPPRLDEAVRCLDTALELRQPLLGQGNPWHRYNLMGVWINRGDARVCLGDGGRIDDAIRCYDEALALGVGLLAGLSEDFPRRIAVAHLNRAAALRRLPGTRRLEDACRSYECAIATLNRPGDPRSTQDRLILAAAWVGKAEALGAGGADVDARSCARRALELASPLESDRRDAAVVGLKARLVLCAGVSRALARPDSPAAGRGGIAEAVDLAEHGLRLAGRWDGDPEFQPLVQELFRFATQAYAQRQPHFLVEFIHEFLPRAQPGLAEPMRAISAQAVARAMGNVATEGISSIGRSGVADTLATFRELRLAQEELRGAARPA